jgi:hypothetical protein
MKNPFLEDRIIHKKKFQIVIPSDNYFLKRRNKFLKITCRFHFYFLTLIPNNKWIPSIIQLFQMLLEKLSGFDVGLWDRSILTDESKFVFEIKIS